LPFCDRAFLDLKFFPIEGSTQLSAFHSFLVSLKSVDLTDAEAKRDAAIKDLNPKAACVCVSKYLKFENDAFVSSDDIKLMDEVRDMVCEIAERYIVLSFLTNV
jgi:hypothetical protein